MTWTKGGFHVDLTWIQTLKKSDVIIEIRKLLGVGRNTLQIYEKYCKMPANW
jgi:hypothetical protein